MRHHLKKICYSILFASTSMLYSLSPYYGIRSQGVNDARELSGWENFINLDNECFAFGTFSGAMEYSRSFRPSTIAQCIFGADIVNDVCTCDPAIVVSGSQTTDRGANDWLADYFGLPTDFKSTVGFRPLIQNFILDLDMYIGLDNLIKGLYFRIDAPITWTKWSLQMRETVQAAGSNAYPAGYFSGTTESNLLHRFTDFITGAQTPQFSETVVLNTGAPATSIAFPPSIFDPLAAGKITLAPQERAGLAELRVALGWNWATEYSHIGANLRFAAPTGNAPNGEFAFESVVGNGKHWELGAGFTAHYDLWVSEDDVNRFGLYVDANLTHMFRALQRRTFDLKDKPNSRYMLAQKLGTATLPAVASTPAYPINLANPPFPILQFQNEFTTVANLTTLNVNVDVALQADVVVMLNATLGRWSFDAGYNYWSTSCEKISLAQCGEPPLLEANTTWALKGDASVIGFDNDSALGTSAQFWPVPLAATESQATIHAGTNYPASGTTNLVVIQTQRANPNIDNPVLAVDNNSNGSNTVITNPSATVTTSAPGVTPPTTITTPQTRSSVPPVFLSLSDVDLTGIRGRSNKFFTHLSYTWLDRANWTPYLGIGGEVEFGSNGNSNTNCNTQSNRNSFSLRDNCNNTACVTNSCVNCAVSQWGVWLKGGVAFN